VAVLTSVFEKDRGDTRACGAPGKTGNINDMFPDPAVLWRAVFIFHKRIVQHEHLELMFVYYTALASDMSSEEHLNQVYLSVFQEERIDIRSTFSHKKWYNKSVSRD